MVTCVKPFRDFGCGQCMPCRLRKCREWTHRIMLESLLHEHNGFLTLTYSEENMPADGSVSVREVQLWIKRFRKVVAPATLRIFYVGEYGDLTFRPHYHAALFGVGPGLLPNINDLIQSTWSKGHIMLGDLTVQSARYIAGYVTKKMTSHLDPRLGGRAPEFARMSLKPGIGAGAMKQVAAAFDQYAGQHFSADVDVPYLLSHGGKQMPLGRYLRRKLREEFIGEISQESEQIWKDLRSLHLSNQKNEALQSMRATFESNAEDSQSFEDHLIATRRQKVLNVETRAKIYKHRRSL